MNNRIVILGAGESGTGSAVLAKKQGYRVFVSDSGSIKPQYKEILEQWNIEYEQHQHTREAILEAEEVIKSPGIPDDADIVTRIRKAGIPVISEIEFAARFSQAYTICITGSNGKTTTTKLLYQILSDAGVDAGLAGNVGNSFAFQVAEKDHKYFVLELSSFQLDGIYRFKPDMAILLNITPDHLDRYSHELEKYAASKFRITQNLAGEDLLIYNMDDPIIGEQLKKRNINARKAAFSLEPGTNRAGWIEDENMNIHYKNNTFTMSIHDLALKGKHNAYNSMAASIAARALDIRKESIRKSLTHFKGVEHRLEHVLKIHGIHFINDSKATNVNSTWYALESMPDNLIWIAGGMDKGNDYAVLRELVRKKVKAIICLGVDNSKIHQAFKELVGTIVDAGTAQEAVHTAYYLSRKGDTVLLSPACASFDLFESYEDRGNQFKKAVREL